MNTTSKYKHLTFSKLTIVALFIANCFNLSAQHKSLVNWLSFDEAQQKLQKEVKPLYIDVYTDWCGWCKKMDVTTFNNPNVASYLNYKFYPVKFDAESKDTIFYNGKTYINSQYENALKNNKPAIDQINNRKLQIEDSLKISKIDSLQKVRLNNELIQITYKIKNYQAQLKRTTHDLAIELLGRRLSYPTTVAVFDSLRSNMPIPGYLGPMDALGILSFVGEKVYMQTNDVNTYKKHFDETYKTPLPKKIKWLTLDQALAAQKKQPKKILISLSNNQSIMSKVFEESCLEFGNTPELINNNFYPVKIDIFSNDTIQLHGKNFINVNGVNQIAYYLTNNKMIFPNTVFLDQQGQYIMNIGAFYLGENMPEIIQYFIDEYYKKGNFGEYQKSKNSIKQ